MAGSYTRQAAIQTSQIISVAENTRAIDSLKKENMPMSKHESFKGVFTRGFQFSWEIPARQRDVFSNFSTLCKT